MKPSHDDRIYLQHILDAIERIQRYLQGVPREVFERNELLQDGVIRQLEIIGEAARHLSSELRTKHSEVPWGDIIGMRNKLIHEYFGVDIDLVWVTVQEDIPDLYKKVKRILEVLGSPS